MKSTKNPTVLLAALLVTLSVPAIAIITASEKTKFDNEIFASKVTTINKVYNQYEASNVTGYSNCIKSNSKDLCLKRMEFISIHFANEYNKKLLNFIADEYGIDTLENKASGRLTAIGVKKTKLEYIVNALNPFTFDKLGLKDGKYSISFKDSDSRVPTIQEAYGMNEMKKGENLLLLNSFNKFVNKDIQDIVENKDEVVSIGGKFAELGLKAQSDAEKEFAIQEVLKLLKLEEADRPYAREIIERELAKESGGSAPTIGKAPALMDTVVDSGKGLFDAASNARNGNEVKEPSNEELYKLITTYNTAFKSVALDLTPIQKETGGKN